MLYCLYYQANIKSSECYFFVAILRSLEHVAFDRTLDKKTSLFEFFVPEATYKEFLAFIKDFQNMGIVSNFKELPNRLKVEQL